MLQANYKILFKKRRFKQPQYHLEVVKKIGRIFERIINKNKLCLFNKKSPTHLDHLQVTTLQPSHLPGLHLENTWLKQQ